MNAIKNVSLTRERELHVSRKGGCQHTTTQAATESLWIQQGWFTAALLEWTGNAGGRWESQPR